MRIDVVFSEHPNVSLLYCWQHDNICNYLFVNWIDLELDLSVQIIHAKSYCQPFTAKQLTKVLFLVSSGPIYNTRRI